MNHQIKPSIEIRKSFPSVFEITEPTLIVTGRRFGKTTFLKELTKHLVKTGQRPGIITCNRGIANIIREELCLHISKEDFFVSNVPERTEFRYTDVILIDEITYIKTHGEGFNMNIKPKVLAATTSVLDFEKILLEYPDNFFPESDLFKKIYIVTGSRNKALGQKPYTIYL
jgi:predicted AAA+ superfamily ATPase